MGAKIRKKITYFEMILKEKFPDITVEFYLSKRKRYLHMGLEQSLFHPLRIIKILKKKFINFFLSIWTKTLKCLNHHFLFPLLGGNTIVY